MAVAVAEMNTVADDLAEIDDFVYGRQIGAWLDACRCAREAAERLERAGYHGAKPLLESLGHALEIDEPGRGRLGDYTPGTTGHILCTVNTLLEVVATN